MENMDFAWPLVLSLSLWWALSLLLDWWQPYSRRRIRRLSRYRGTDGMMVVWRGKCDTGRGTPRRR